MNKIKYSISIEDMPRGMKKVCIRCEQFNSHIDIDTNVHIFNDEWDDENGLVINNPNAQALNILIRKTLYQMEEIELGYQSGFTLSKLKKIWDGKVVSHDFYDMMEKQIEKRDEIRESTKEIHRRVLVHLRKYKSECNIADLTEEFVKGFIQYMKAKGLKENTQRLMLHAVKCYYNIARKYYGDKIPEGSFDFYHETKAIKMAQYIKPFEEEDIRVLENYVSRVDTPSRFKGVLDRFLFMSYTGVRISDFLSLNKDNFTIENGRMWLTYTSVKTSTPVRLPISNVFDGRAEQIINKYINNLDLFFHIRKDSFNQKLKTACKHAGINKRVSAHTARHTFASRLVNRDVPITTIQKVIGHRALRTTQGYAITNDKTIIRQLS